eukprot:TRINITY_DN13245_c0_g1_i1.p1 TRINITY_DN13245_c0_g1~~TRINITY_DN13245_c0_g1_i1.p1  ORF type:complete len:265 (-),score=30.51 TRINITY_DN13245_c0_g1_i1:33-827(-)
MCIRDRITDKTLPFPSILYSDNDIIIETFIEGNHMSQDESPFFYKKLGECIRKFHSIKTVGFGPMHEPGIGKFATEREMLPEFMNLKDPLYKTHHDLKLIDTELILSKHMHRIDAKESLLIHLDLFDKNILVKDGKLAGIIDFANGCAGTREQELAMFYCTCGKNEVWEGFVEGYGKDFDWVKVKFYVFVLGAWQIAYNAIKEGTLDYKKYFQIIKELLACMMLRAILILPLHQIKVKARTYSHLSGVLAVSYTHLTLPTICSV